MKFHRLIFLVCTSQLFAQNAAPSSWLNWSDQNECRTGDLMSIEVRAPSNPNEVNDAQNTYYSSLNFNQGQIGGGYAGIQYSSDGEDIPYYDNNLGRWVNRPGTLFIFSLWDTNTDNPSVEYIAPGKMASESFGGEGTGMKTWSSGKRGVDFDFFWDDWNTITVRSWNCQEGSCYGFFVNREIDGAWHHLARLKVSSPDRGFHTANGSFLEDWSGSGSKRREVHYRQAWRRSQSTKTWCQYSGPRYSVNQNDRDPGGRSANYFDSWDGGVETETDGSKYWFMKSGGAAINPKTTQHNSNMPSLGYSETQPQYPEGKLSSWEVEIQTGNVLVDWQLDSLTLPQFSTLIEVRESDSQDLIYTQADTIPELREVNLPINLDPQITYQMKLTLVDIFDQETVYEKTLQESTVALGSQISQGDNIHWAKDGFTAEYSGQARLYDLSGQQVWQEDFSTHQSVTYPQREGVYYLKITHQNTLKELRTIRTTIR